MSNPARHLTNYFHLLSLLQGRLNLLALRDLLPEMLVGLFQLSRSLPHLIFQVSGKRLTIK